MREIRISDITIRQTGSGLSLSFNEKLEVAKMLDKLGVDAVELNGIENGRADSILIKSIARALTSSVCAVPAVLSSEGPAEAWDAVKDAVHPRLQVSAPVSPAQMEYIYHKKPAAMKELILSCIRACAAYTSDVEFIAVDAARADEAFLCDIIREAIAAGAEIVTLCETAGEMLPPDFRAFLAKIKANVPELENVTLAVECSDGLSMADACGVVAMLEGVGLIKSAAYPINTVSLKNITEIITKKGEEYGVSTPVHGYEIKRATDQINRICSSIKNEKSPFDYGTSLHAEGAELTLNDDMSTVIFETKNLGYDLSEDDQKLVYDSFRQVAAKKGSVSGKELDAIVASAALQVPPTYILQSFVINSGSGFSSTAHISLASGGKTIEAVSLGDGPVAASFLAIEQIVGRHYELDDFEIQAVTEGREALGEAIVKLRADGKVYSGRGLSTDIIASAIRAYISCVNKIVYEEEHA